MIAGIASADSPTMDPKTKVMLFFLMLIGLAFTVGVLRVIGAWYAYHVKRHDLIVQSKRKRYDYFKAVADREREAMGMQESEALGSVIIEDEEPTLAQAA